MAEGNGEEDLYKQVDDLLKDLTAPLAESDAFPAPVIHQPGQATALANGQPEQIIKAVKRLEAYKGRHRITDYQRTNRRREAKLRQRQEQAKAAGGAEVSENLIPNQNQIAEKNSIPDYNQIAADRNRILMQSQIADQSRILMQKQSPDQSRIAIQNQSPDQSRILIQSQIVDQSRILNQDQMVGQSYSPNQSQIASQTRIIIQDQIVDPTVIYGFANEAPMPTEMQMPSQMQMPNENQMTTKGMRGGDISSFENHVDSNGNKIVVMNMGVIQLRERPEESSLNILRAFIFQYLWTDRSIFSHLTNRCESLATWDPFNPDAFKLTFNVMWAVFSLILDTTTKSHIYCVIDAVDECAQDDTTGKFLNLLMTYSKKGYGDALKLLISGRPDWQQESGILSQFTSKKPPLEVRLEPELTSRDIAQIVDVGFAEFEEKLSIEKDEVAQLKQKLVTKANGMVLWAALALREIKKKLGITLGWLRQVVESLPSGVSEMYDRILWSLQQKYEGYGRDEDEKEPLLVDPLGNNGSESDMLLIWKAMLWVARAGRALTLKELDIALSVHLDDTCFADSKPRRIANIEDFVRRISFFEIVPPPERLDGGEEKGGNAASSGRPHFASHTMTPSPTIRLIHQSAKDYILKTTVSTEGRKGDLQPKDVPTLDDGDITAVLVTVLKYSDFENGAVRDIPGSDERFIDAFKGYIERFGLLEYAAYYWPYHMSRMAMPSDELIRLVDSFVTYAQNHVRFWCQVRDFIRFRHPDFVDNYSRLHIAAENGINFLVRLFIARGDNPDERDQHGRTPYMMAVFCEYHDTAKILEDAGADTSLTFGVDFFNLKCPPLHCASSQGDLQTMAELLQEGRLVDEVETYGRTSLFYAGQAGNWETIEILLGPGADPLSKDKHGRHPLDVTLGARCREILLEKMKGKLQSPDKNMEDPAGAGRLGVSPCTHNQHLQFDLVHGTCDRYCCDCSPDSDSYEICNQCWEDGRRCPGMGHSMLTRINIDGLVSWLEYSPALVNAKVKDPRLAVNSSGWKLGRRGRALWRRTRLSMSRLFMRRGLKNQSDGI
ncbi:hypothetical protein QBC40DRAFT_291622 [Triangularia verruculosa]|uniref:Nephrocystin 3-like N-terminal domain-containing protein n=1 Tax=Triangularia verruculosa TaxID=2587418 RepID=A0AAN6XTU3_9PEZI|nr:hypothetical protein QBC40DRAFT_291622 [Triangularia verruculosa]